MAIKTRPAPEQEQEPVTKRHPLTDVVANNVLKALGTPPRFLKIKSSHLFDNRFRVNVYQVVKQEFEGLIKKNCICDSFYCIVDEKGEIQNPKIQKKY